MAKVPGQRKSGQTGGGGYRSHGPSMGRSVSRGGRPHAGGGGMGKKPPGKGCAVTALVLAGGIASAVGGAGYGAWKAVEAMF